ncbi:MAG: hypothetical protein IAE95_06700 [Chitinophagaceae bacterium]|nr:hypothetical protein [Chitinophagaceae bacterium]
MNNNIRLLFPVVLVVVTIGSIIGCRKEKQTPFNPPPPPPAVTTTGPKDYTKKMEGAHTFVGTDTTGFFPVTGKNDTQTYNVAILNDSTVVIANDTLGFAIWSAADKYIFFSQGVFPDTTALTYYYAADSIAYYYYSRPTSCCFTKKVLHTIR